LSGREDLRYTIAVQDAIDAPLLLHEMMMYYQATRSTLSSLNVLECWNRSVSASSASILSILVDFQKNGMCPKPMGDVQQGAFFEILMQGKSRSRGMRPRAIGVTFWGLIPLTSGVDSVCREFGNPRRSFPTRQFIWPPVKSCFPITRTQIYIYNSCERVYAGCRHPTTQQCPIISESVIS
jgi:hypothetical protein